MSGGPVTGGRGLRPAGHVGPFVTFVEHRRPDGHGGSLGVPPPPEAPRRPGRPPARPGGRPGPGDGGSPSCSPWGRCSSPSARSPPTLTPSGQLGRGGVLRRVSVLHVCRVSDVSGGGGRDAPGAGRPGRRKPSSSHPGGSTGGRRRCSFWGRSCSTSAVATHCGRTSRRRPHTSMCGDQTPLARSAFWLPARSPGSRSATAGSPGAPVVVVVDHAAQPDRVRCLRHLRCRRVHQPGDRRGDQRRPFGVGHLRRGGVLLGRCPAPPARAHRANSSRNCPGASRRPRRHRLGSS